MANHSRVKFIKSLQRSRILHPISPEISVVAVRHPPASFSKSGVGCLLVWRPDMLHRAIMGMMEPSAVNLHPESALLERGGCCQPAWGHCWVSPHLSISLALGSQDRK